MPDRSEARELANKLAALTCRFSERGCKGPPVGLFHVPQGCVCWTDPVQALCHQHVVTAESVGPITCVMDFQIRTGTSFLDRLAGEDGWRARQPRAATNARPGWWTHDTRAAEHVGNLYYFAPTDAEPPPYRTQRHVQAIIDIAADGTLAGVELIDGMPPPPLSAPPVERKEAPVYEYQKDDPRTFSAGYMTPEQVAAVKTPINEGPAPAASGGADREWVMVPRDDPARDHADSILPDAMVDAGAEALEKCRNDLREYVSGVTPDWDDYMIAVAVYRAMLSAAPAPSEWDAETLEAAQKIIRGFLGSRNADGLIALINTRVGSLRGKRRKGGA